jgi:Family of unknown function (DUF5522)
VSRNPQHPNTLALGDDVRSDSSSAQLPTEIAAPELQPGDFYMEGAFIVFTEQYHLRRGYCCNSNCRHCPFQ